MSPSYWKRRKAKQLRRSRLGVAARADNRLRLARAAEYCFTLRLFGPRWPGVRQLVLSADDSGAVYVQSTSGARSFRSFRAFTNDMNRKLWRAA